MVKCKGSTNSHVSIVQEQAAINIVPSGDLAIKMDKILGIIQGYEGKTDTTMKLMLDMQKRFEEKLEALREENNTINAQLNSQKNDLERAKSFQKSKEEGESHQKNLKNKEQSSRETLQRTKEPTRNEKNKVSNTASSYTREKKKDLVREKKSTKSEGERPLTEMKITRKLTTGNLDERCWKICAAEWQI